MVVNRPSSALDVSELIALMVVVIDCDDLMWMDLLILIVSLIVAK